MFSLYIHVPFCKTTCRYCDFFTTPHSTQAVERYLDALCRQWGHYQRRFNLADRPVYTIYMGGGTPSILEPQHWRYLQSHLFSTLNLSQCKEWTVECNPESYSVEKAEMWQSMGVNRLSVGIQSVQDKTLLLMRRQHSAALALEVLRDPVAATFRLSADCMTALPGQSLDDVHRTLRAITQVEAVEHISVYELMIKGNTPFAQHRSLLPLPDEKTCAQMSEAVLQFCEQKGFENYEVSNFAKPGRYSLHNMVYWHHKPWIGIGPGAHSFYQNSRFSSIRHFDKWVESTRRDDPLHEHWETLTRQNIMDEFVMLRLRTKWGIDVALFNTLFGFSFTSILREKQVQSWNDQGIVRQNDTHFFLTPRGFQYADHIAANICALLQKRIKSSRE